MSARARGTTAAKRVSCMKHLALKLHWQILIALLLAVLAGLAVGKESAILGLPVLAIFQFTGDLFLNALKMLIVPLVVSSIITGMAGISDGGALGRLGGKTLVYYLTTTLLAVLTGLLFVDLIQPGVAEGATAKQVLGLNHATAEMAARVGDRDAGDLAGIFLRMIPANVVTAAAEGEMLGLIFFSLLFGYFMTQVPAASSRSLRNFWQGVFDVMLLITDWVMKFSPVGVFALVAGVVASTGLDVFIPLAWFFLTVVLGLAVHTFVTLPLLLRLIGGVSPARHFRAMAPALLTAFSTSSSSATLPVTMECVEKNAGVSNRVSSFVLPLGATVNMDGTALYECVAAMFIAQAYGIELGFTQQFIIVLLALLTSIGVAGIPAASLVAITVILTAVGLPAEGIGLILAVDRVLDMCRTSVNVFSDSCGAVVLGRLEGEQGILSRQQD